MLNNVIPQRGTFFQLLASHTDRLVGGANATMRLLTALGAPGGADHAALIEEVNVNENSADDIKAQYIRLLYESFTTPLNRQQMHVLMKDLDRVLDTLQSVANGVRMYHIESSTTESRMMASLGADACLKLNRAVTALADRHRYTEATAICHEIEALEDRGAVTMREAITRLFAVEGDEAAAWHAMKMRRFYTAQEDVLYNCKRAAHTIEEIVLENR
ncbi:MAG: DUF47 family protein [Burkholderiales bacterium]|nr:DUF47 family protein [Burkholderiales bacterium]